MRTHDVESEADLARRAVEAGQAVAANTTIVGYQAIAEAAAKAAVEAYRAEAVSLEHYARALDEVYFLRQVVAYEAGVRAADLGYKSYPKSRRVIAEERIRKLRAAACGWAQSSVAGTSYYILKHAMKEAGASESLTRHQWEENRARTGDWRDFE